MRPPPGLPSRDCPGALWADLTLEEGGRGDGRCRRRLPQQTDSSVPGMPKTGCRCRVHAIAPHWPGGVGSPALASPTGRGRKSLRGVGLTSLLFSHWLEERRDQGTRPGAREASEAPVSPRSVPVSPRSAPAATRPPSFSCGAWAAGGVREGARGGEPHCDFHWRRLCRLPGCGRRLLGRGGLGPLQK